MQFASHVVKRTLQVVQRIFQDVQLKILFEGKRNTIRAYEKRVVWPSIYSQALHTRIINKVEMLKSC